MTTLPPTIELMARYLSTQYPNKNSTNQHKDKKGDRNKKGDDLKPEDKDSNFAGTTGAHVGDTTPHKESNVSSGGTSIGAYVLEAHEQVSRPTYSVEEILGAHLIRDDDFWGVTNPSDVSIDTVNSKKIMADIHITEQHSFEFQGFIQPELLNMTPYKPQAYDFSQNFQLNSPNNFKDLNILLTTNNVTVNVTNTTDTNDLNQEN